MKSVIVLQRVFLAVEFLFYIFRALSTYIFETYFTFSKVSTAQIDRLGASNVKQQ
jgi:hypothetical protein